MPRPPTRSVALTSRTTARADRTRRPSRRRVGRDFRDAMRHGNTEYALQKLQDHAALAGLYEVRDIVPPKVKETWQYDAYAFADIIGEVGYALGIKASTLSRCKIKPQVRVPNSDEWDDTDDPRVHKVLRGLQPRVGRQGDLLAQACMHYEVAGDCYLYGDPKVNQFGQTFGYWWQFYSVSEFKIERKGLVDIMSWGYGAKGDRADPDGYAKRFHNPKAEYSERAISAVYRVLPLMRQLVLLEQLIDCIAKSSMSAGILFMPNDISFGPMNEWDDPGQPADGLDEFESELHEHTAGAVVENTSPARLNPLMVRAKGMTDGTPTKDLIGIIDLSRDIDKYCVELRKELVGRIASGLDVPAELVTGKKGANHWCVDDQTEVLTLEGWTTQDRLRIGDIVLTLNHETGMSEWQPVKDIYRADVVDEPMTHLECANHSSVTTPQHRWPVLHKRFKNFDPRIAREWTTTEKMNDGDRVITSAPCADLPTVPKYADDMVELIAWFWTEGHYKKSGSVAITQSHTANPHKVDRIRGALTRLFGPASETLRYATEPAWREAINDSDSSFGGPVTIFYLNMWASAHLMDAAPGKIVCPEFVHSLTLAQLQLFTDVSEMGDGQHHKRGLSDIWQRDPEALDGYELALHLQGRMTRRGQSDGGAAGLGWRVGTWNRSSIRPMKAARDKSAWATIETEAYTGTLWCPVTGNTTWFARRNGTSYFTGNSAWSIDDDFISQNVIPIGQRICDFLTAAYLRPFLVLTGMTEQESEWFRLELDATPVTSDVDQSANATTAYIAGQITAEAWIRYLGLDEEDMPTADEEIRRLYLDLLRVQPQNAPTLMKALFPEHDFGSTFDGWITGGGTAGLPGGVSDIPVPHDSGQPQRTSITYGLERMIAAAADRNLDAAIAQAARRLVGRLDGIDGDAAAGLRRVDVQDVLTVAGPSTAQRCGVGASDLFAGAFDGLGVQVTDWLSVDMASRGVDPYEARSRASIAADELKAQLTLHAGTSLTHRISRTPNGTRIPDSLIASAIAVGEMADTSAQ